MSFIFSRSRAKYILISLFILISLWDMFLNFYPDKTSLFHYLYNGGYALIYLMGAVAGVWGGRTISSLSAMGKSLIFLGLGMGSYAIGLLIWMSYNLFLAVEVPYPSVADIFFIPFFCICMGVGLIHFLSIYREYIKKRHILMMIGIIFSVFLLVFGFLIKPEISNQLPFLTQMVNIAYPLVDTVLLSFALIALLVAGGRLLRGSFILVVGLFFQVAGDVMFTYRTANKIYWNGDIADYLFTVSAFILSYAIIQIFEQFNQVNGGIQGKNIPSHAVSH